MKTRRLKVLVPLGSKEDRFCRPSHICFAQGTRPLRSTDLVLLVPSEAAEESGGVEEAEKLRIHGDVGVLVGYIPRPPKGCFCFFFGYILYNEPISIPLGFLVLAVVLKCF